MYEFPGKSASFLAHCIQNNIPYTEVRRIFTVVEQYPHSEIASFTSLSDAQAFMRSCDRLALPLITSRAVAISYPNVRKDR